MAGVKDNALLRDHEFKFDETRELKRSFGSRAQARSMAQRLRRAGYDSRLSGTTLVLTVPADLALKATVFGGFHP